jgi:hypothetical protein
MRNPCYACERLEMDKTKCPVPCFARNEYLRSIGDKPVYHDKFNPDGLTVQLKEFTDKIRETRSAAITKCTEEQLVEMHELLNQLRRCFTVRDLSVFCGSNTDTMYKISNARNADFIVMLSSYHKILMLESLLLWVRNIEREET